MVHNHLPLVAFQPSPLPFPRLSPRDVQPRKAMTMTSTRSIAFPPITRTDVFMIGTKRLWLRWPSLQDAPRLARIGGDPLVARRTATWPEGASEAYCTERIERMRAANADGSSLAFAIVRLAPGTTPSALPASRSPRTASASSATIWRPPSGARATPPRPSPR